MTKLVSIKTFKSETQPLTKGTSWFMTNALQVGRRLRFRSYGNKVSLIYTITQVLNRDWKVRKGGQAEMVSDRVRMRSETGEGIDRVVMGLRVSVNWELLDD